MKIIEAIDNRISALFLKKCDVTVQTSDGDIGDVQSTSVIRGTATLRLADGRTGVVFKARNVGSLDDYVR